MKFEMERNIMRRHKYLIVLKFLICIERSLRLLIKMTTNKQKSKDARKSKIRVDGMRNAFAKELSTKL